jgi:hypothetical protein
MLVCRGGYEKASSRCLNPEHVSVVFWQTWFTLCESRNLFLVSLLASPSTDDLTAKQTDSALKMLPFGSSCGSRSFGWKALESLVMSTPRLGFEDSDDAWCSFQRTIVGPARMHFQRSLVDMIVALLFMKFSLTVNLLNYWCLHAMNRYIDWICASNPATHWQTMMNNLYMPIQRAKMYYVLYSTVRMTSHNSNDDK